MAAKGEFGRLTAAAGGHNDTWQCPKYYEAIVQFIAQVTKALFLRAPNLR